MVTHTFDAVVAPGWIEEVRVAPVPTFAAAASTAGIKKGVTKASLEFAQAKLPDEHGLTRDEVAAVHLYTTDEIHKTLNESLRSARPFIEWQEKWKVADFEAGTADGNRLDKSFQVTVPRLGGFQMQLSVKRNADNLEVWISPSKRNAASFPSKTICIGGTVIGIKDPCGDDLHDYKMPDGVKMTRKGGDTGWVGWADFISLTDLRDKFIAPDGSISLFCDLKISQCEVSGQQSVPHKFLPFTRLLLSALDKLPSQSRKLSSNFRSLCPPHCAFDRYALPRCEGKAWQ